MYRSLFNHLARKGRMLLIGSTSSYDSVGIEEVNIPALNVRLLRGSMTQTGFYLPDYFDLIPEYLPQLIDGVASGRLKVQLDLGTEKSGGKFFGVDQIYRGEACLQTGQNIGKVVVQLQNV